MTIGQNKNEKTKHALERPDARVRLKKPGPFPPEFEFYHGQIIHAKFTFKPHYAIIKEDLGGSVDVYVVTSKERYDSDDDAVRIEPSHLVPFGKKSFIKCGEVLTIPKTDIQNLYEEPLPSGFISEIQDIEEEMNE